MFIFIICIIERKENFMQIGKLNNTNFKARYYEGCSTYKNTKKEFHFEVMNNRPDSYLTQEQNNVTQIIEEEIDRSRVNFIYSDGTKSKYSTDLELVLDEKHTDIYFRYPNKNTVEAEIVKWGYGGYGDEYCYTPYNKDGSAKIKIRFSLDKMPSIETIKEKTAKFISDSKEFLTDDKNPKNKQIENKLWKKC